MCFWGRLTPPCSKTALLSSLTHARAARILEKKPPPPRPALHLPARCHTSRRRRCACSPCALPTPPSTKTLLLPSLCPRGRRKSGAEAKGGTCPQRLNPEAACAASGSRPFGPHLLTSLQGAWAWSLCPASMCPLRLGELVTKRTKGTPRTAGCVHHPGRRPYSERKAVPWKKHLRPHAHKTGLCPPRTPRHLPAPPDFPSVP